MHVDESHAVSKDNKRMIFYAFVRQTNICHECYTHLQELCTLCIVQAVRFTGVT